MPQLNPSPWLKFFTYVWIAFLTLIPTKVLNFFESNKPTNTSGTRKGQRWSWPW
uniref:ATP synthase complex subunit 8 n=1 Tax=Semotilus corporalis TaxID=520992 RepID=A0A7S9DG99_9TELE|nr:ATP synthase subunit 8 [Semotilus corporalis]QPF96829.1 ATP synthase subunit 8 [Semotilus corporalis]QWE37296.1 ATP synthase F0 subunit 8 [Semotilus corporalis]UZC54285.1 ATP synthase F0 subunit 8 [Semotilus corporalis]